MPAPETLSSLWQARAAIEIFQEDQARALSFLRQAVAFAPSSYDPRLGDDFGAWWEEVRGATAANAWLSFAPQEEGVVLFVDGRQVEASSLDVVHGLHLLQVSRGSAEGGVASRLLEVEPSQTLEVLTGYERPPPPVAEAPRRWPPWALAGASVAALGVGGVLYGGARIAYERDGIADCTQDTEACRALVAFHEETLAPRMRNGLVWLGVGAALGGGAGVWWWVR